MAILKCKMCGGDLIREGDQNVATCDSCGTTMTLPSETDEQISNLFNRANHYRRNFEFDRAAGVYEKILEESPAEAEAYWGMVLCRYGIEYVEDPGTHKRIPTCHRARYESILSDVDYRAALDHANGVARQLYEAEAKQIDSVQKQILKLANSEAAFDVFLCYKEKGPDGNRTRDSVLAQEIYQELTELGYKVFFARITLEEKLGEEYEPTIFAALNSARVMVAVGTSRENLESVWVKNEWGRYLELIKKGEDKKLIPAYRDMDPYDLPEEFARLQALDMEKIGFIQDLSRGIQKILEGGPGKGEDKPKEEKAGAGSEETSLARLAENGTTFLKLEYYDRARELYHRITDLYPEAWQGWWGLLCAETKNFSPDTWEACGVHVEDGRLLLKEEYQKWKITVEQLAGEEAGTILEPYHAYLEKCRKFLVQEQEKIVQAKYIEFKDAENEKDSLDQAYKQYTIEFEAAPSYKNSGKQGVGLCVGAVILSILGFILDFELGFGLSLSLGLFSLIFGIGLYSIRNDLTTEQKKIIEKKEKCHQDIERLKEKITIAKHEVSIEEGNLKLIEDALC